MPVNAATDWGYARVSSEEQARGVSIDAQVRRILERGIPRDRVVIEVESATKGRTKELFKLFQRAREGQVNSILSIRQDRFQRTRKVEAQMWELIDEHDVKFKFLDQTDIDKDDPTSTFQARVLGASAQFETELLQQRVKNGINENKLKKKHHGRAPFGYICKEGRLLPDPEHWETARSMIECYLQTGSSTAARKLRFELTGKTMGASSFSRWILSPNIRGAVVYNASKKDEKLEIFWGQHPPLLQPHEYDSVQSIREKNRTNTGAFRQGANKPSLGTGLFQCACCGGKLIKCERRRYGHSYPKYQCRTVKGGGCTQGYSNNVSFKDAPSYVRRAISFAAFEIADSETAVDLPEPPELASMKDERDTYLKMDTLRSTKMAQELQADIDELEKVLRDQSSDRFAGVRKEFEKLTDPEVLAAMDEDDLRSLAVRYGLLMTVDNKNVIEYDWTKLGTGKLTVNPEPVDGVVGTVSAPKKKRDLSGEELEFLKEQLSIS